MVQPFCLRRHYPDQVLRVESCLLSSQPVSQAPRLLVLLILPLLIIHWVET